MMRVMLDTNILISAIVFESKLMLKLMQRLTDKYLIVLCSYVADELYEVVSDKFPAKMDRLEKFLIKFPFELVHTPQVLPDDFEFEVRDKDDEHILYSAVSADVDVLITGDKDLLVIAQDMERPEILSHLEFLEKY